MADNKQTTEKRKRSENFPKASLTYLCELVEENYEIITSKQSNAITNAKKKLNQVWQSIADSVNARAVGSKWSAEQLKEKWRKSCSKAKLTAALMKKDRVVTGGGPPMPAIDETTQKIIDLHEDAPHFTGVEGGVDVGLLQTSFPDAKGISYTGRSSDGSDVFSLSLPYKPATKHSSLCIDETANSSQDEDVIVTSGLGNLGSSIVMKAHSMKEEIKKYLQNYTHQKALPKVGDSIFCDYADETCGISEEERDDLTRYLCSYHAITTNVYDVPSMVHNTIAFIMKYDHSKSKEIKTSGKAKEIVESATCNLSKYRKRKIIEDYQIQCLQQENAKLKTENQKLLNEIELIKLQKSKIKLQKQIFKLQLKKLKNNDHES